MAAQRERPRRADAQRNREAVLFAAREAFAVDGISAPLDRIAVAAGVGNATLYRNFPTRDHLLVALLQDPVDELLDEFDSLGRVLSSAQALEEWLFRLAWQIRVWRGLPSCIAAAVADGTSPLREISARLTDRTRTLLCGARDAGFVSSTVAAEEVFVLVTATAWAIDCLRDDEALARRRIRFATAGCYA